jgi:site-specific DNA-methyltransferase (adenine-specific)
MMLSNPKIHRYNLIWNKQLTTGFLNANRMPLRQHEDIMVFYKMLPTYNPQKTNGDKNHSKKQKSKKSDCYGKYDDVDNSEKLGELKYPTSILNFSKPHASICRHEAEKPIELIEWLIKTYTNEGDTVHDSCVGSGTTLEACSNLNRNCIAFELRYDWEDDYNKRLNKSESLL